MAENIYDIFISYRRKGGFETAKHLNDLLIRDGYTVSFDIDTLREGRFDNALLRRIDQCTDFILVVDEHAFDRTLDPNFDSKKDWLRIELAYALKIKKNVIPILLSEVEDFPANLPEDISVVSKYHGPKYQIEYFDNFYEKLKGFLHCIPRNLKKNNDKATVTFNSDVDSIIYIDGEEVAKVITNGFAKASISLGEHIFLYKLTNNPAITYSESQKLDSNRNYVIEIKSWKFKTHKIPIWIKIGIGFLITMLFVWGGSLIFNNDNKSEEIVIGDVKQILVKDTIPRSVIDSLISKPTLGKMSYRYTGPVDSFGLPHGKGTAKYQDDNGICEGYFNHGVLDGEDKVKQTLRNGDVYMGTIKSNEYDKGDYLWKDGEKYSGTFLNGNPYTGTHYNSEGGIVGVYDKGKYKRTN